MIYYIRLDNDYHTTSNKQEAIITAINLIIKHISYWYTKYYVDENDNDTSKSIMKTYIAINNKQYECAISHFKGVGKVNFIFKEINNEFIENFDEETKKSYNKLLKEHFQMNVYYVTIADSDILIRDIKPSLTKQGAIYSAIQYKLNNLYRDKYYLRNVTIDSLKNKFQVKYVEESISLIDLISEEKYEEALLYGDLKLTIIPFEIEQCNKPVIDPDIINSLNKIKKLMVFK